MFVQLRRRHNRAGRNSIQCGKEGEKIMVCSACGRQREDGIPGVIRFPLKLVHELIIADSVVEGMAVGSSAGYMDVTVCDLHCAGLMVAKIYHDLAVLLPSVREEPLLPGRMITFCEGRMLTSETMAGIEQLQATGEW